MADGVLPREDVLEALHRVLTSDESSSGVDFVRSSIATTLCDLWPGDSLDVLNQAYDDGDIDPFFIGREDVESDFQRGMEAVLAEFQQKVR